jgi:hypothetical protein
MSDDKTLVPATGNAAPQRRSVLLGTGLGAAALALGSLGFSSRRADAAALTDADILNFALNLEYLEAEFYLKAAFGITLSAADVEGTGKLGAVTGGSLVPFANAHIKAYAHEIAQDELAHVQFLRAALGSAAVARPAIDLATSFTLLARAAGVVGPSQTFNPFLDDYSFLLGAFIFEDVGVTAYHGAAPSISSPAYLAAAAGILAIEAYHAGLVRVKLFEEGLAPTVAKISALRAALSGAADDQGVIFDNRVNIAPRDSNGVAFARTPAQVLNIVYGGGAANNYLFFPDKMNGAIS